MEVYGDGPPPKTVEPAARSEVEKSLAYELPADLPVYPDFLLAWATVPGKRNQLAYGRCYHNGEYLLPTTQRHCPRDVTIICIDVSDKTAIDVE